MPLHSDLHEENILDADGALGIIDFGEALIGPAAWEFASLGYFMDWPFADATLAAYATDGAELARLRKTRPPSDSASGCIAGPRITSSGSTKTRTTKRF